MTTALWISAVGGAILFVAIALVVGLMYLLTWPKLFPADKDEEGETSEASEADDTRHIDADRRRRAVALAVAAACAGDAQMLSIPSDTSGDWRHLHRARQLARGAVRRKSRL